MSSDITNTAESNVFQPVDKLPEHLVLTSRQVSKFSGRHLSLADDPEFDWAGFKHAIDSYTGDDLSFDKYDRSTIYQQTQETGMMMKKVAEFLHKALSALVDLEQLGAIVENTFTNLKELPAQRGCLNFTTSSRKGNSSWEYRILFSVPFGSQLSEYFYCLVTTIRVTADIQEKSAWWGLTSSTTKNFGVQIDALRLVVRKGFRAPAVKNS